MWEYETNPARWVLRVGPWQAIVERLSDPPVRWLPHIERIDAPNVRHEGAVSDDPIRGRTWCLEKIAELRQ